MSAMVYWLLVPVRLSGNPSQQRRTTLSRLSSTSIPTLNQTQPAKNSRPVLFQAGVALRPHPRPPNENCWQGLAVLDSAVRLDNPDFEKVSEPSLRRREA